MSDGGETVVIGLGNPLMGDDGLGLAALEQLEREWRIPATVRLVDGGTWGMRLLPVIEEAGAVLFLDAIDTGRAPGELIVLERDQVPHLLGHKLSAHEVDLPEVLALGQLRGTLPARLIAAGLQPARVEMSTSLSPEVARRLGKLVGTAAAQLLAWGQDLVRRPGPGGFGPGRVGYSSLY